MIQPLQFQLLTKSAKLPTQAHEGDAGWDLYASARTTIPAGRAVDVPFEIAVCPPPGTWCRITGRSSALRGRGLHVVEGVIDAGYRGPLFAGCHNITSVTVVIAPGERIAQLILMPLLPAVAVQVTALPGSERGALGFGSSGI